ncbi:MAG: hypothetical protein JNL90_18195 [Planctomycetes bacterium]|nr:hypothetical protein [Planctomycetota bacterium]
MAIGSKSRRSLRPPAPPPMVPLAVRRLLLLSGSALLLLPAFGWLAARSRIEVPEEQRPPPDPRLFELVPADLMTTREGLTVAPGPLAEAADRALCEGDLDRARAGYAAAVAKDGRDRYAALLAACLALEQDDLAAAEAMAVRAAAPVAPLYSPLRSVRVVAELLARRRAHPAEPFAESYLAALIAAPKGDGRPALHARDPLRELFRDRLYRAPPPRAAAAELAVERGDDGDDLALFDGSAPLALLEARVRSAFDGPREGLDHGRDHAALLALAERARATETALLDEALARASAHEPDNAYWEWCRAALHSPAALGSDAVGASVEPTLGTDDEPDVLPGFAPETLRAFEEALVRPRCEPRLRELLAFEEATRRAAGDRFAALRLRPPHERLFLGEPRLAQRLAYRALIVDRDLASPIAQTVVAAGVALTLADPFVATDPRLAQAGDDTRAAAASLLEGARALRLDVAALEERIAAHVAPPPLSAELAAPLRDALEPLPIPRLVDALVARYAADLIALADALQRAAARGG